MSKMIRAFLMSCVAILLVVGVAFAVNTWSDGDPNVLTVDAEIHADLRVDDLLTIGDDENTLTQDIWLRFGGTNTEQIFWDNNDVGTNDGAFRFSDDARFSGDVRTDSSFIAKGDLKIRNALDPTTATTDMIILFGGTNSDKLFLDVGASGSSDNTFKFTEKLFVTGDIELSGNLVFDGAGTTNEARITANSDGDVTIRLGN